MTGLSYLLSSHQAVHCYVNNPLDMLTCSLGDLTAATSGEALFGVLVAGISIYSLWQAGGGDMATPTVVTIIGGALMVPLLPGSYVSIAWAIVITGIAVGVMALAGRFVLSGVAS